MKKIKNPYLLLFAIIIVCSCGKNKQYLSGNPSEILDVDTYNQLQQKYSTIKKFQEGTAVVKKEKYGLIDCDGEEILPCEYDSIYKLRKNFRVLVKDSLFGATDIDGKIIKPCSYNDAFDSGHRFLAMKMNDKWGFIDNTGKDITQYKYEHIYSYTDSTFVAKYNGYFGVCDYKENILIPFKYNEIMKSWMEECPVTIVQSGEFYGLYNSKNVQVLDCKYDYIFPNSNGLLTIKKNAQSYRDVRKALIEAETGKILIPFDYLDMGNFSEGLVSAENLNEKWGFLDKNGKTVLPFIYDEAGNFSEGLAAVYKHKGFMNTIFGLTPTYTCGYINKKGEIVIPYQFQETMNINMSEFHEGLAVQGVGKNNKFAQLFGYINKKGEWFIKPKFDEAEKFENGVAKVVINDKCGYINVNGEQIIPCEYDIYGGGYIINDSIIYLQKNKIDYYFDLRGKILPDPDF